LVVNLWRVAQGKKDLLTGQPVSNFRERIAWIEFVAILILPVFALNAVIGAMTGTFYQGGLIGVLFLRLISQLGYSIYLEIFARLIALAILMSITITSVAMVNRVVQLQMIGASHYFGRWGYQIEDLEALFDDIEPRGRVVSFSYSVFFGYAVFLLLVNLYAQFGDLLPVIPFLSQEMFARLVIIITVGTDLVFLFFWIVSVSSFHRFRQSRFEFFEEHVGAEWTQITESYSATINP